MERSNDIQTTKKKTIAKLAPAAIVSNNNTKKAMREAKERKNPNTSSF